MSTAEGTIVAEADTYTPPPNGWCCFHCGETFPFNRGGYRAARVHFGATPDWAPDCIERRTKPDNVLLDEARRSRIASTDFMRERDEAITEAEVAACTLQSWQSAIKGAKTSHDARCAYDSLEGRALAAEAVLGELQISAPDALLAARTAICGPGTYFPLPQLKGIEVIVWTPVEQELPDSDLTVMITLAPGSDEPTWLGYHDGEKWRDVDGMVVEVAYWANMVKGAA
ncbi:hypothetical protein J2W28_002063 [Variovorax boronicumulans]|uniref:hypothetical protein n=1 Tax=Variovorax boronicumulans TaxID=436515 RepID=UPI002787460A|nr:hypothetical protein [Variovorax boronicumulans]MDP9990893.1 hypothetical protein [Variovorax boronicumulans]MDQ0002921.1 hypothetical protein [Variovorax boronicumulans]